MYSVNKKKKFIQDHKYIRNVLRQVEQLMAQGNSNDWSEIESCYCELSGVAGTLETWARENKEGNANFRRDAEDRIAEAVWEREL